MPFKTAQQSGLNGRGRQRSSLIARGAKAVGGTVTFSGNYVIHTFNDSGVFVPVQGMNIEYVVVAGGGGGGRGGGPKATPRRRWRWRCWRLSFKRYW